jgi:hypothetical protein
MTIRLKNSVTPNSVVLNPERSPTMVLSAATDAACELGMPPVSTKRRRFHRPCEKKSRNPL